MLLFASLYLCNYSFILTDVSVYYPRRREKRTVTWRTWYNC